MSVAASATGSISAERSISTIRPKPISLPWSPIPTQPGDLLFFDSYLPHRSAANLTDRPRRALYLTYNKATEGNVRDSYYREKRAVFPPDAEREPGRNYGDSGVFNVGNPIR
jgi:ectoine hydroxylase-related dioxygenase (phytanoyl-CoA dioxygenase family)